MASNRIDDGRLLVGGLGVDEKPEIAEPSLPTGAVLARQQPAVERRPQRRADPQRLRIGVSSSG
jgi:hypothetical protein